MADMPFDTMATVRLLRESGIEERQAQAIANAIKGAVTGGVATKTGIHDAKAEIHEVNADIARIKIDLKWMKLIGAFVLAVIVLQRLAELVAVTTP